MCLLLCLCARVRVSTTDYSTNYEIAPSNNSARAKSKLGFLENLNAKLAEQRLSGKAFAVRNIINSKALVSFLDQDDEREGGNNTRFRIYFFPQSFRCPFLIICIFLIIDSELMIVVFSLDFKLRLIIFSIFFFISLDTRVEEKRW